MEGGGSQWKGSGVVGLASGGWGRLEAKFEPKCWGACMGLSRFPPFPPAERKPQSGRSGWMEGGMGAHRRLDGGLDGGVRMECGGLGGLMEGWMEGVWAQWMEGWVNHTGTETNRNKNRSEPREPKPNQIPSEKPKRTETKRGFTDVCANSKTALAHEALGTMFADCLHYQVDLLGGDAKHGFCIGLQVGNKNESVDIRGGMYQTTSNYFLEAWAKAPQSPHLCFPRAQFVSANSLCLLKQYEDLFAGRPYKDCDHPDWSTFPRLDPMVATVFEWGHSMDDENSGQ